MSKELNDAKKQNRILIDKYIDVSLNTIRNLVKKIKDLENQIKILKDQKKEVSAPVENENEKLYQNILNQIENIKSMIKVIEKLSLSKENNELFLKIKTDFNNFDLVVKTLNKNTENRIHVDNINKIYKEILNLNENIGKVRVFLRIKPFEKGERVTYKIEDKTLKLNCDGKETLGGPFYNIIDDTIKNDITEDDSIKNFKTEIVDHITKELDLGKSLCLFGYGLSGSGKTYTMLGPGGVLDNIIHKYKRIELEHVFEQYVHDFEVYNTGTKYNELQSISGKIINLFGDLSIKDLNDDIKIKDKNITENNKDFLNQITKHRISQKRIKETPNNPESSRSTLYIVFKIKEGVYLVIVDCAGRESPEEIKNTLIQFKTDPPKMSEILNKNSTDKLDTLVKGIIRKNINNTLKYFINKKKYDILIDIENKAVQAEINKAKAEITKAEAEITEAEDEITKAKNKSSKKEAENKINKARAIIKEAKNKIANPKSEFIVDKVYENIDSDEINKGLLLEYLQSMFKEGYYINETLNHLIYFLNAKIEPEYKISGTQTCIEKCGEQDTKTKKYEFNYDPLKFFIKPKKSEDPIKTITIMNWIEEKCKPKYMMFCMIRQENDKCIDSAATLNFANSIKST